MTNKFISFLSLSLENGSRMTRDCIGINTVKSRKLFTLLFALLLSVGQMWAAAAPTGWTLVESLSGLSAGDKIIIVTNDGSKYFNGTQSSGHFQVTALSASAPASASAAGVIELVSTGTANRYKLKLVSTNKYVTASAAKSGSGVVNSSSDDSGWTFYYSSGFNAQYQKSGQQAYCRSYNNGSFRTYANTTSGAAFEIYKYSASTCTAPTITAQPTGASYNKNATPTALSVTATGTNLTYQWYSNTTNSTSGASSISGATSSSYTPPTGTAGTKYYYCIVSSSTCTTTSNIVAVTITVPVSGVSLNKTSTSIVEDQNETLTATVSPNDATNKTVNWSTSDASIATVSGGVVTAKAAGTATITATSVADGTKSASCTVTVTAAPRDHFVDLVQSTEIADKKGSFSTPTIDDKAVATSGTCEQQHYHFVGWITSTKYEAGTAITDGDLQTPTSATGATYYAVWAKQGTGSASATGGITQAEITTASDGKTAGSYGAQSASSASGNWTGNYAWNTQNSKKVMQINATSGNSIISPTFSGAISNIAFVYTNAANSGRTFTLKDGNTSIGTISATASTTEGSGSASISGTHTSFSITASAALYIHSITVTYSSVNYTDYIAECCNELGSINGSVSFTNGEATVSFDDLADVTGWGLKYKKTSDSDVPASWSTYSDSFVEDNGTRSNSTAISGLVAESQYDFKVTGTYNGSNYCTGAFEATLDPTTSYYVPKMEDPSVSSITNLGYIVGAASSTAQSFTISVSHLTGDLTVTAPDNFQVSKTGADANDFASTATLTQADGTKTVWVRLATGLAENTYGGNTTYVTITGGGAAGKQVSVTGVVGPACHNPNISGSLSDATYNLNAEADALTITATKGDNSDPDLTYQWLQCTSSDGTYVNAVGGTGATTNSYTPPTTTAGSDLYYKCKVNSGNCFDYSGIAHIQVNTPVIKLNDATSNINLAFGDRAVDATTGYTETFTVSGQYLGADISIAKNGTNEAMFTLSASSVTKQNDGTASTTITVTYKPSAAGEHSATLTLSSAQATSRTVSLSGTGKWLVTWNVVDQEDPFTNLAADGGKPTLPSNPSGLTCKNTFKGWSKKNGETIAKTTSYYNDLFSDTDHAPTITEATTFYAVFGSASAPSTDLFTWEGGTSASLTALDNVAAYDLGTDYAAANTPYLVKLDGTGDYIDITVTSAIASVAVDVKMIGGGNTSSITVKESANGENFTDVETLSISGAQNDVLNLSTTESFASTSRVVRLYFTKGSNVGVGPISITGVETPDLVTECAAVEAPTFSPAAGEYHEAKDVTISCATVGYDEIRYTTDGTDPTKTTGTVYSSAITVDETTTIKAIAVKGDNVSDVVSATYTITYPRTVTFNTGTGTLSIAPATSITEESYGEGITLPSATPSTYCVAEGWTFAGWATTNSTITAPTIVSGTYTPESDITLYAVYKKDNAGADQTATFDAASVAGLTETATKTWTHDESGIVLVLTGSHSYRYTSNTPNTWSIGYGSEYGTISAPSGTTITNIAVTLSDENYKINSVSNGTLTTNSTSQTISGSFSTTTLNPLTADYGIRMTTFTVTYNPPVYSSSPACCDDEVNVSKADNPSTGTFMIDKSGVLSTCAGSQVVTVTCVPNAGYHVDEVTETIETDVTIEETEENVYTVTYAKNVSGTSTISVTFAETLTPSFQISQNAFEIGDVAVGATVQRQFTISAAHLEGTSLSITSSNDKFSVSPTSLTIKADGSVDEATVTVTLNTAEANIGGPYSTTITLADGATTPNTATVSLTNATIKNQYNVKWYNGTTLLSEADYLDGATISDIPTAASCDPSISHVGWLPNATISGKQADAPAGLVANEDIPAVTADVKYHAVFAKVGEASWRNTALADLTSEDIFVIAETTASHALYSGNGASSAPTATDITIENNKITSEVADELKWKVSGNATDGYTFYPNGNSSKWLYCTNDNNGVRVGTGANKVFTINGGYLKNTANNRYIGVYNNADWRCYTSTSTNINDQSFAYFKYIAPETKDYMTTCAVTFTATYEAGAGTGDDYEDANLIEKNADYTVLGNDVTGFTKADYRFNGWKCGDDDYAAGETYESVTADLTFVAQWTEKEEAGLEYETSAYEVIQNGSFTKPTLTNPHDLAVTYSSSNTAIATVDAEGNVTLKTDAIGSTTITASSEATDTYKAGEASYTLSVASKWALTYTSNVELVENSTTKASSATVNGYDAIKCGTGDVAGAMQITVPKNTEKLHIHAVGWKGESVTISFTGATASPNSVDLTADNSISGSGSSYTLNRPSTFYTEISLSNITEVTTLTLEATSGKRFVVYGVNEEGGIWELPSDDANESAIPDEVNVVVSEDQSLTITNAKTLNNLTVEAGGSLTLNGNSDKKLTVNDLTIETKAGQSGQVSGTNVQVSGDIYLEIKLDASGTMDPHKWYCISAPFAVAAFEWGDGTPMVFNVDYQLFKYDGEKRANTGNGWQRVGGTMEANTAYFIGFDDENPKNQNVIRLKAANNTIPTATAMNLLGHNSENDGDKNWYGLGNPALQYVGVNMTAHVFTCEVQGYDVIPHWSTDFDGFVVGSAFFVQGTGVLSFDNAASAYHAPKRQVEEYTYCVEISKEGASRYDNRIFVRASEDAESTFVQGKDEYTLNNTSSNYGALLWTENYGGKRLAIEEAPLVNATASYVLTLSAPKAGTYSISVAAPQDNADLYLTYEGTIIWNLSESAYTMDLNKGTTNGYGLLLRAKVPSVVTGVENGGMLNGANGVQKVIIDEHVYILRGGQMYDVNGKMVK